MYAHIQDPKRRKYAGMVTCLDDAVKNITDALREKGLWDNTLLIFSSDNGGSETFGGSNAPLVGNKAWYFEGGIRVPAFVSGGYLTRRTTPKVSRDLMHITDWFPTLL